MYKEKTLKEAYSKLLEVGFGEGPLEMINQFIDEDVMGYGTAQDEKIMSLQEFRDLIIDQRKQAVNFDEFSFTSKPVINRISDNGNTAVIVDEIILFTRVQGESNELSVRMSTVFELRDSSWKLIHWHGSKPEHISGGDDPWHVNEWKRKNEELQKLVEEKTSELLNKNKELEIETALEKVRSVAMGMKKPEDMLEVCQIISDQLQSIGVNEIRNVQTAIFDESKSTYLNYEFYTKHVKTFITEVDYKTHELQSLFANEMINGAEELFVRTFSGKEVKDWYAYQQTTNQFADPFLETAESLNYYWYSLGPVALGMSTYAPLNNEEINLFKRFRNVFELAYRRFLDIQKAEAQAREAKIEAALERVRSRSMGMHSSDELREVVCVVYDEMEKLDFEIRQCVISILNDEKKYVEWWSTGFENIILPKSITIPYDNHYINDLLTEFKSLLKENVRFRELELSGEKKRSLDETLFEHTELKNLPNNTKEEMKSVEKIYLSDAFMKYGMLEVVGLSPISSPKAALIQRFATVFEQTYTRFLDIKKAEAQAREAQIEASLERVRSRSMGMQKSEELKNVIRVVYEQFVHLKINVDHAGFVVDYTPKGDWHFWIADEHEIPSKITHPYFESVWANQFNEAKEKGIDFFATNLNFEEKNKFYNELLSYVPGLPESSKDFYLSCPGLAATTVLFDNVSLYIENFSGIPYTDEENNMLMRFGKVFQQTYTRFLDLQKAETQAREAQIEAALERVRSRTMGMQRSDELAETVSVLFKQLLDLGVKSTQLRTCGIVTFKENEPVGEIWITDITGEIISDSFDAPYDEAPAYKTIYSKWKSGEKFLELNLKGEAFLEHLSFVKKYSAVPNINLDEIKKLYNEIFFHVIYFSQGYLFIISYEALTEFHGIFKRFGALFHQTYTRFLDFKRVEAQNKIIQAENDRKTKELEDARQLQLSMLPRELPKVTNLEIAVYMKTATEVGGDYYDFHIQPDGTLNVLVGDATGHGMMSGMMVSIIKSFFIASRNNFELKQFFENSNSSIKDMQLGRLMMACIGVQITHQKLIASNAGMPSLLYFRNISQKAGEFVSNNLPFGGIKGTKYSLKEISYEKGDTLLLMSDGLAELKNKNEEQYGYARVKKEFMSVVQNSSDEIIDHLKNSANEWADGVEPDDDVTFVVIKVK